MFNLGRFVRLGMPRTPSLAPDALHFARSLPTLADLVAPAAVEVARDHLRLETQYVRVLAVTGLPRRVGPGWLDPLLTWDAPVEASLHLQPLDSGRMVQLLSHRLVQFHSSRLLAEHSGRLADPERDTASADAERLRDVVQRGEEKLFAVSLYLLLRAGSLADLATLTRRIEAQLNGMLAHSRVALLEQAAGFHTCLPEGLDRLQVTHTLNTTALATMLPLGPPTLVMERGMLYGVARPSQAPVIIDPFDARLDNANMVICARSGAGKSYFTKVMALRQLLAGTAVMVVDPEDEYRALCRAVDGQHVRVAGSSTQHLNPFDLLGVSSTSPTEPEEDERDPLAERVAALLGLLAVMLGGGGHTLTPHERAVLDTALYQTYGAAGITRDPATHTRPVPLMRDLLAVLQADGGEHAATLAQRLQPYVGGSMAGLFSGPTNVALDRSLVVFDIQGLAPDLRAAGIQLITGFLWNVVRRVPQPRLLVIDEAWSLLQYPEGGVFLADMARRARKYYLGLVAITQNVADFLDDPHGRTVVANAAIKFLLKQDESTIAQVQQVFRLADDERRQLLAADKGEGLFLVLGNRVQLAVTANRHEHMLATTNPRERADLAAEGLLPGEWQTAAAEADDRLLQRGGEQP